MKYTQKQIKQAEEAVNNLPSPESVVQDFVDNNTTFQYKLYCYNATDVWSFRAHANEMARELLGEHDKVAENAYWKERREGMGTTRRKWINDVERGIYNAFLKVIEDYRLTNHFGKRFDVKGSKGARPLINCEVKNAYAIKQDGYYFLSIRTGDGDKSEDYEYITTADSLKELALGLPYLINLHEERCRRELKQMKERGELTDPNAVPNKWFLTDEMFDSIMDEVNKVEVQTYALVRRGHSEYVSFQVTPDRDLRALSQVWKVVGKGMPFALANEMQGRMSRVVNCRQTIDRNANELKRTQERLKQVQENVEESASEFVSQCRNLDTFLNNNNIPEDVIVELNKSLTKIKKQ